MSGVKWQKRLKKAGEWWEYDLITNSLANGTVEDWERIAQEFPDFPHGRDNFINRHWISNAIIEGGSIESVKWMISKGVNLCFMDGEGLSLLHWCLEFPRTDKLEMMQLLIDSGADINIGTELGTQGRNGWTPLHMAVCYKDIEAVKLLLKNNADTTLRTPIDDYSTAEEDAVHCGNHEAAELIRAYNETHTKPLV